MGSPQKDVYFKKEKSVFNNTFCLSQKKVPYIIFPMTPTVTP